MSGTPSPSGGSSNQRGRFLLFAAILVVVLAAIFHKCLEPNEILFANDGPLGAMKTESSKFPNVYAGHWVDCSWLGFESPSAAPSLTGIIATLLPPEIFLKFFGPLSLAFVGFSVWLLFRQLRFGPMVCLLGGLAGALNMNLFSDACWGLGTWVMAVGCIFLAAAALVSPNIRYAWARAILAGLAIGMSVMEGFDVGAFLSIFAGIFVLFVIWNGQGSRNEKALRTVWMPALVVGFSVLIAAHTLSTLVGTQIKGIKGAQETDSKESKWAFATGGSVPKMELLRIIIPGVYGYHMDSYIDSQDKSSAYWGRINESVYYPPIPPDSTVSRELAAHPKTILDLLGSNNPEYRRVAARVLGLDDKNEKALEQALVSDDPNSRYQAARFVTVKLAQAGLGLRHSASGKYAGLLVAVLALFGLANSFRRDGSGPLSLTERRAVWFWGAVVLVTVMLALGRHGFLYRYFFEIPYSATIRNPEKFLFPFHVAWLILAGYGLESLRRAYLESAGAASNPMTRRLRASATSTLSGFDKGWRWGSILMLVAVFGILFFVVPPASILKLQIAAHGFSDQAAAGMASFLQGELAWFGVFLVLSVGTILLIMNGVFAGPRVRWAYVIMGMILVTDLVHSDLPWIRTFNVAETYKIDPLVRFLQDKPYEHRVTAKLGPFRGNDGIPSDARGFVIYFFELQNQMPYLNIQSLDVAQMPRRPELDEAYIKAFVPKTNFFPCFRLWQLTNTRYILGSDANPFGIKFAPENGCVPRLSLGVQPKPGYSEITRGEEGFFTEDKAGPYTLYELTNALPRAKLYSSWLVTNDQATLDQLVSPQFDPEKSVIVSSDTPVPAAPTEAGADPGSVTISSYKSKHVVLKADAKTSAVMLLNDRVADDWHAEVDGKPANILRCNFIMRGIYLPIGEHTVEFRFQPKLTTLYISLSAWVIGFLVAGLLVAASRKPAEPKPKA